MSRRGPEHYDTFDDQAEQFTERELTIIKSANRMAGCPDQWSSVRQGCSSIPAGWEQSFEGRCFTRGSFMRMRGRKTLLSCICLDGIITHGLSHLGCSQRSSMHSVPKQDSKSSLHRLLRDANLIRCLLLCELGIFLGRLSHSLVSILQESGMNRDLFLLQDKKPS